MTMVYESKSNKGHDLIGAVTAYVAAKLKAIGNCIPLPNADSDVRELDDRSLTDIGLKPSDWRNLSIHGAAADALDLLMAGGGFPYR